MTQRFYQKASVQVSIVSAIALLAVTGFTILHQRSQLRADNQDLQRDCIAMTAEIQRLETLLTPFRTIAVQRFTGPDNEALKKLADQIVALDQALYAAQEELASVNRSGLMWVKAPHALTGNSGEQTWTNAIDFCNGLTHAGQSDWRLPNRFELESLLDLGRSNPALPSGHPFTGVQSDFFWSSSTRADRTDTAWSVTLLDGDVFRDYKTDTHYVWPVRAGQ